MGMYTEFFFRALLREDTPSEVIAVLRHIIDPGDEVPALPDAPLFTTPRWTSLSGHSSSIFPDPARSYIAFDELEGWNVAMHSNFKNYGNEIALFFDWIHPYVDGHPGTFMGFELCEVTDDPTTYHTPRTV